MLFSQCIHEYLKYVEEEKGLSGATVENYAYELNRFHLYFKEKDIDLIPKEVTLQDIHQYISWLRKERGYKPASVKRILSIIRSFFNYLVWTGACGLKENPTNNIPSVRAQKKLPLVLSLAESQKFLRGIKKVSSYPARDYAIFLLFLQACCRLQELQQLKLTSIDLQEGYVDIDGLGGLRRVPLTPEVCEALADYLDVRNHIGGTDFLFLSPTGSPMNKSGISSLFKSLAKKTGVYRKGLSVHKLRHTCLAFKLQEGVKIGELQEIAGHASPSSTSIYKRVVELQKIRQLGMSVGER